MNTLSPTAVGAASAPSHNQSDKKAVDGWFNEGGHFELSASASEREAFRETVRRFGRAFRADFTSGLVGDHHNTFQHRSRVLRQLTAKLRAMTAWQV